MNYCLSGNSEHFHFKYKYCNHDSMRKIYTVAAFGALGLSALLSGCGNNVEPSKTANEYIGTPSTDLYEAPREIEGRIVKVQTNEFMFGRYGGRDNPSHHQFEYVLVMDNDGNRYTLVYPYPQAF